MLLTSLDRSAASAEPLEIVYDRDREVADFVGGHLGWIWETGFHAIGLARGFDLVGGVVYSGYSVQPRQIEASIFMADPRWASRRTLRVFFGYPFIQLHVHRLQTRCEAGREDIGKFNEKLGFRYEGTAREAWTLGGDAWFFAMLNGECKWLAQGEHHG